VTTNRSVRQFCRSFSKRQATEGFRFSQCFDVFAFSSFWQGESVTGEPVSKRSAVHAYAVAS